MSALRLVARIPFTLFGVVSITTLILTGSGMLPLKGIWHLLMLPAYLLHLAYVVAIVALVREPPPWLSLLSLPLQLGLFVILDVLLARRRSSRKQAAAGAA